jgi:hypothetical protein
MVILDFSTGHWRLQQITAQTKRDDARRLFVVGENRGISNRLAAIGENRALATAANHTSIRRHER